jgi:hypothetical protein
MTKLDDAIRALCALRQEQDPVGYIEFLASLFPRVTMTDAVLTYRDLGEPHSGTVTAEGRTFDVPKASARCICKRLRAVRSNPSRTSSSCRPHSTGADLQATAATGTTATRPRKQSIAFVADARGRGRRAPARHPPRVWDAAVSRARA